MHQLVYLNASLPVSVVSAAVASVPESVVLILLNISQLSLLLNTRRVPRFLDTEIHKLSVGTSSTTD